jgi:hypothetical protein
MISFAEYPFRAYPIITSSSMFSLGPMARDFNANALSTAWGTINQARYMPFWIPEPITVVKLLAYNGGTTGGNTDIGLYDSAGTEIVGIAAAAQAGTNTWQEFDITDTPIVPGLYYVGLLNTTTTGTYFAFSNKELGRAMGVYSQAVGAGTLPSPTATFAALDAAVIPIVGIATRTLI